jgi:hypothetical protein
MCTALRFAPAYAGAKLSTLFDKSGLPDSILVRL